MSDKTTPAPSPVITVGENADTAPKQSFWQRKVVAPVKAHPKIALAVAGGAALVAGSAFLGRKSAQYDVLVELQPSDTEVEEIVVLDTSSSNDE